MTMVARRIRLVSFDALHTLITPHLPVHIQYSQAFSPYLGVLDSNALKVSFKVALKNVQEQHPSYPQGAHKWWQEVIRQTAIGAGANERAVDESLPEIVPVLLNRFSSKEGYAAFSDAIPTIKHLRDQLGIYTGVISNSDLRIRLVLKDLEFPNTLTPIILSEEVGVEKPSKDIFHICLDNVNKELLPPHEPPIRAEECLHIGDELKCDYEGAISSGMNALLLRRLGKDGEQAHKELGEKLEGITVISELSSVIAFVHGKQ